MRPESKKYWDIANPENNRKRQKKYVEAHPDKVKAMNKRWRDSHPKEFLEMMKKYQNNRYLIDPNYKLGKLLRSRMNIAIRNSVKKGSAIKDLGCSNLELKIYIESKFKEGMSWDNWGIKGWHLDHIKPLCYFDLGNRDQFLEACNYKNLQPLWWYENLKKGHKERRRKDESKNPYCERQTGENYKSNKRHDKKGNIRRERKG